MLNRVRPVNGEVAESTIFRNHFRIKPFSIVDDNLADKVNTALNIKLYFNLNVDYTSAAIRLPVTLFYTIHQVEYA